MEEQFGRISTFDLAVPLPEISPLEIPAQIHKDVCEKHTRCNTV